jgi:hypothetical protein
MEVTFTTRSPETTTNQVASGVVQTLHQSSGYDIEASLDLEYGMTLVTKSQKVTLYQVGDIIQGEDDWYAAYTMLIVPMFRRF